VFEESNDLMRRRVLISLLAIAAVVAASIFVVNFRGVERANIGSGQKIWSADTVTTHLKPTRSTSVTPHSTGSAVIQSRFSTAPNPRDSNGGAYFELKIPQTPDPAGKTIIAALEIEPIAKQPEEPFVASLSLAGGRTSRWRTFYITPGRNTYSFAYRIPTTKNDTSDSARLNLLSDASGAGQRVIVHTAMIYLK